MKPRAKRKTKPKPKRLQGIKVRVGQRVRIEFHDTHPLANLSGRYGHARVIGKSFVGSDLGHVVGVELDSGRFVDVLEKFLVEVKRR